MSNFRPSRNGFLREGVCLKRGTSLHSSNVGCAPVCGYAEAEGEHPLYQFLGMNIYFRYFIHLFRLPLQVPLEFFSAFCLHSCFVILSCFRNRGFVSVQNCDQQNTNHRKRTELEFLPTATGSQVVSKRKPRYS